MPQEKQSLGQAIDQIVHALSSLEDTARKTALIAVCAHMNIELGLSTSTGTASSIIGSKTVTPPADPQSPLNPQLAGRTHVDIRTLKDQKKPVSARQMACLVAFYLQEHAPENERKDSVSAADLEKYFKQAGFKLPQHLQQILPDAKSSGYFNSGARGEYKLNAVGYNLVAHNLPSESVGK